VQPLGRELPLISKIFMYMPAFPLRYLHDTPPQVPMQAEKWEDFAAGCDSDKKEWAVSL